MSKKFKKGNIHKLEMMDSIKRREYAYINSDEYKQLYRDTSWTIVFKLIVFGWLSILLVLLVTSIPHLFSLINCY
jgi:hypothetical protein